MAAPLANQGRSELSALVALLQSQVDDLAATVDSLEQLVGQLLIRLDGCRP